MEWNGGREKKAKHGQIGPCEKIREASVSNSKQWDNVSQIESTIGDSQSKLKTKCTTLRQDKTWSKEYQWSKYLGESLMGKHQPNSKWLSYHLSS